ncbi:MAG: PDZ domain-containing protein [Candidatus Thiodiazotropha sp. (ex Dulcina madagascariensis)]|nr:PDZ domain-containing protein [Candidatus Thiodiazotropha sp. (ex Dulcina madagascariensis)]
MNEYKIGFNSPQAHLFEVELTIRQPDPNGQVVYLPAWIRGSYLVRDFARNIVAIQAVADGRPVSIDKLDKQTWKLEPVSGEVAITCMVYAWELSVRTAHFDTTHAYFNGPSLFLGVDGQEGDPCRLIIPRPCDPLYKDWRVAIAMPAESVDGAGFGAYVADDYEALIDYPAEIGRFSTASFYLQDRRHRLTVNGVHSADLERFCNDLQAICAEEAAMFGDLPIDDYLFMLQVVGDGYGGLEHRNSTSLMISRESLPIKTQYKVSVEYRKLLALCSHEYFHLWNVKRIMPAVFLQQGTQQEVHTRQLWIFEGITSYYDELILMRSGVIERKAYFEMMAETVTRLMRSGGRHKQTLEASSFDAWTKFYKQDENAPNAIVSYYTKGALFALVLDLTIRLRSNDRCSLDHLMRELWQRYGKRGIGVPEKGFEALADEVTSLDLSALFELGVRTTQELPLAEILAAFAVEMYLLPADSCKDQGGVAEQPPKPRPAKPVLGAKWSQGESGIRILQVFDGGGAQRAGLCAGDEIVAVDGLRMSARQMERYIAELEQGASLRIHLFRGDGLAEIEIEPLPAPLDTCTIYLPQRPGGVQQARLNNWLKGYAPKS